MNPCLLLYQLFHLCKLQKNKEEDYNDPEPADEADIQISNTTQL